MLAASIRCLLTFVGFSFHNFNASGAAVTPARRTHSTLRRQIAIVLLTLWTTNLCRSDDRPPSPAGYQEIVAPFVKSHCVRCHGPAKQEGHFRVDQHLKNEFLDPTTKEKFVGADRIAGR